MTVFLDITHRVIWSIACLVIILASETMTGSVDWPNKIGVLREEDRFQSSKRRLNAE
jgi:hypothetical protein